MQRFTRITTRRSTGDARPQVSRRSF
ncbi:MAG: hypothetical protein QOF69_2544, partial [Solirubrobacteraceae bacterium]|nr:hypothetical protein [Solirubrobacteraceae bacterium]